MQKLQDALSFGCLSLEDDGLAMEFPSILLEHRLPKKILERVHWQAVGELWQKLNLTITLAVTPISLQQACDN